ncbi:MAG: carboxypeptidase regulatory-like domain-containing protein [Acidobacteria bacterium]|nr:carboxypeptidase regulatory-like domain-containing protein [Acidobacteriota bacterium]
MTHRWRFPAPAAIAKAATAVCRTGTPRTACAALLFGLLLLSASLILGQNSGTIQGKVVDASEGVIPGAAVKATDAEGVDKASVTTDAEGTYRIEGLPAGVYTVRASAPGFSVYENLAQISPERTGPLNLDIKLTLAVQRQEVTVTSETSALALSQENNTGALILTGEDLDALADDPDDLADALQALAGPSAGPNGGQFYIDGFEGNNLPPKSSIREIRINQNPFSSEFDRLGFGRIEILTRPGTDRLRGQVNFNFNDESLNSRDPFAPNRAPYQSRRYGGNLGGPLKTGRSSFFLDFDRGETDDNAVISATILDGALNIVPFSQVVLAPQRRSRFSPRLDLQLNDNNTLVARYNYLRIGRQNQGVGEFSLPSRAYDSTFTEHELNITETAVISSRLINETRFAFERRVNGRGGDDSAPALRVLEAFTGGGAQVGVSTETSTRWELQNATSWTAGTHSLKAGGRLRAIHLSDASRSNFGGTFIFGGGLGPELDSSGRAVLDAAGQPVLVPISSLERYRRTLLLQSMSTTPAEIRALGGGATQFSIVAGDPQASVTRADFSIFLQDDWRLRTDFLLSLGMRYEIQTNIDDKMNFAPRIAFAWSPGAGPRRQPATVFRGGFGIFYDRFGENYTLEAERFNGSRQRQFIVSNPDFFPDLHSIAELQSFAAPQTIRRVAENLRAPYSMQTGLSIERQLPLNFTMTASYIHMRTLHVLWSRNINAPLAGTFDPNVPGSGVRPFGNVGNIYQYQSDGVRNQNQMILGLNNRFGRALTLFGNYTLGKVESDSDGAFSFPADPYSLSSEYGRAGFDVRHRFVIGGSIRGPWGLTLNPMIVGSSGRPFNITTGRDTNGDTVFTERPALATDLSKPGVIVTHFGAFDPDPAPGQAVIPRNFGEGPGFFLANLRISKTFSFGASPEREPAQAGGPAGGPPSGGWAGGGPRGGVVRGGPGGFRGGFGGGGASASRYNLTFSVQVQNLFNNTNFGPVVGNLSSPLFGVSNSTLSGFGFRGPAGGFGGGPLAAGNRRIELQLRFNF